MLIIMGPSCAGKSTLVKKMIDSCNVTVLALDDIENSLKNSQREHSEEILISLLIEQANQLLMGGHTIVIDTNIYSSELETIRAEHIKKVVVYCPLHVLLERNKKRDENLQRATTKKKYALEWVKKTFAVFEDQALRLESDWCFDSSVVSADEMCKELKAQLVLK